ncbi:MAG: penicillin-binding transpeptidase domain-containing protein, partial [Acidimicrobiia bacterium]|nr:penicillin-binding transpeptidase domain-containing protein [Acidimicrobiia bacterium]
MRRILLLVVVLLQACAVNEGVDPDATTSTTTRGATTTLPFDEETRLQALDTTGRFVEAVLDGDGFTAASLSTDPPATVEEEIDAWATAIGLESASYTIESETFTATTAEIGVRLNLELLEVGHWAYSTTVSLVGGGPWSVLWSPSVLHPSLEAGDVVRVDRQWLPRAPILARDGTELAGVEPVKVIGVVPAWVEDLEVVQDELLRLAGIDPEVVTTEISRPAVQPDWFVPVGTVKSVVYAAVGDEIEALPGVIARDGSERLPFRDDFASHLIGSTGPITAEQLDELGYPYGPTDVIGQTGIEAAFESQLAGRPRTAVVRVNKFGRVVEELHVVEAVEPSPVQTTIDVDVQTAVEQVLDDDERRLAVVVLDAPSGQVLATASRPLDDGFDRARLGAYPPGSTFKIVTASGLLDRGYGPDTEIECPGDVDLGGRVFRNASDLDLGVVTFETAFARSCNTSFASAAVGDLDDDALRDVAERFGFNSEPAAGVPAATPAFPDPVDTTELAAAAIGQGRVVVSPMHMASVAGAVGPRAGGPPNVICAPPPWPGLDRGRAGGGDQRARKL